MKKRSILSGSCLTAGICLAAMTMTVFAEPITMEEAESIAMEDAGIQAEEAQSVWTETDYEDGWTIYNVEFITGENEAYDYEIDAENGMLLNISYENKNAAAFSSDSEMAVSLEQAKEIAAAHAKRSLEEVTFVKLNTEQDEGRLLHELEFCTADLLEYEYDVDARTGEIISWEYDAKKSISLQKSYMESGETSASDTPGAADVNENALEAAKAAALEMAGLTSEEVSWGNVYEEYDDGRRVYEGEFFYDSWKYEFKADADTGALIDWEEESLYD